MASKVTGKGGGQRKVWYEVACEIHGAKTEPKGHKLIKVAANAKGCPRCISLLNQEG